MTALTVFYELRVRELAGLTAAKALSAAATSLRLFSLFPPAVIGLYLRCTLYLRTTADWWLCPEAWGPSLKCQEINKAWEQGSTRSSVNGHRLPHPHSLDGFIPRPAFSAPQCLPMDVSIPAHGIGISTPTPSHCPLAGVPWNSQATACPDALSQDRFWGTKLGHPPPDMADFHLCVYSASSSSFKTDEHSDVIKVGCWPSWLLKAICH